MSFQVFLTIQIVDLGFNKWRIFRVSIRSFKVFEFHFVAPQLFSEVADCEFHFCQVLRLTSSSASDFFREPIPKPISLRRECSSPLLSLCGPPASSEFQFWESKLRLWTIRPRKWGGRQLCLFWCDVHCLTVLPLTQWALAESYSYGLCTLPWNPTHDLTIDPCITCLFSPN